MTAIHDWNAVFLQAVREEGGTPGPIARAGAILHLAMYDVSGPRHDAPTGSLCCGGSAVPIQGVRPGRPG